MQYIQLVIAIDDQYQEALIAELMELEFDEFQQKDDELITYIPKERFHIGDRERIEQLLASYPGDGYIKTEEVVDEQNWNTEWEKTIRAQSIGRFFIRPTWSDAAPGGDELLLEIDPKMSFGTGYHETTRLMLRMLPEVIGEGKEVLDAGTGTGILAIAAVKLGAAGVFAFDIDKWSITNAEENVYLNGVEKQVTVKQGTHEVVPAGQDFDVILANIQQNIIADMMPFFSERLRDGGDILLSGLLKSDESKVLEQLGQYDIDPEDTARENEWIAIRGRK